MNGILYQATAVAQWGNLGAGYPFDGTFASNANVNGYPKGARVMRSDSLGYWLNLTDNNTTDPESAGAVAAGWVPDWTNGIAAVTMTNTNVTLTNLQWGKPIIVISGTITGNLNLIFPNITGEWVIVNNTTGAFSITCKTVAGTGVTITGIQQIIGDATNIYGVNSTSPVATATAKNCFINGGMMVAQRAAAPNISTAVQFGAVDRWACWISGGTVSAGTIGQNTASTIGRTGFSLQVAGLTTGSGATFNAATTVESKNALRFKNQNGSFSALILHNFGGAVNWTITLKKPTTNPDDYSSTTTIGAGSVTSVPNTTGTMITLSAQAMGDVSNGFEFQLSCPASSVTGRNIEITEVVGDVASIAPSFDYPDFERQLQDCQRYYETSYDYGVAAGTTNAGNGALYSTPNYTAGSYSFTVQYKVRKRIAVAAPVIYSPTSGATGKASIFSGGGDRIAVLENAANFNTPGMWGFGVTTATGALGEYLSMHFTSNAEIVPA